MPCTSRQSFPTWARAGAIAAIVVAGIGVVGSIGAPSGADVAEPVVVSRAPLDVADAAGDRSLAMSDDGAIVAYDTGGATAPNRVLVEDRANGALALDLTAARPDVSGDGCVVAVNAVAANGNDLELVAHDLCSGGATTVATAVGVLEPVAPAVSRDGSVIAWSATGDIVRYSRDNGQYVEDAAFAPALPDDWKAGGHIDIGADGSQVVFEAAPASGGSVDTSEVWLWTDADGAASVVGGPGSVRPAISGDGSIVAFESSDPALGAGVTPPPATPFVVVYDAGDDATRLVADGAWRPALSSDGHQVAFRRAGSLDIAWWSDGSPFESISTEAIGRTLVADDDPTNPGPTAAVSAHGRWVAFDGDDGASLTGDPADDGGAHVWLAERPVIGGGDDVAFGEVDLGATVARTVTIVNRGTSGAPLLGSPTADAPLTITSTTCAPGDPAGTFVLQPGASCDVAVSFVAAEAGALDAAVTYPVAGVPAVSLGVTISGTVRDSTATTAPPSTLGPPVTSPPRPVTSYPQFPSFPDYDYDYDFDFDDGYDFDFDDGYDFDFDDGFDDFGSSGSTDSESFESGPGGAARLEPLTFTFPPTIIGSGRRTTTFQLVNDSTQAVSITGVSLEPATEGANFTVLQIGCDATPIPAGSSCPIDVEFAPAVTGEIAARLVAELSDGLFVEADVIGIGADPPVLTVTPQVAAGGQVVTVRGSGFPVGTSVTLRWNDGRSDAEVAVSDDGGIVRTIVVLPHVRSGPSEVVVAGQDGLFADVSAELLVARDSSRSAPAVRNGPSRPVRQ